MNVKCMLEEQISCPYCSNVAKLRITKVNSGFFADNTEFTYEYLCYTCVECNESFTTGDSDTITLNNYNKGRRGHNRRNKINDYFR